MEKKMISSKELLLSIKEMRESQREERRESQKEFQKEMKEARKETDKKFQETAEQMKETDRKLDRIGKMVGGMSNNLGDVAEEFFYNTISSNPTLAGVKYNFTDKNITRKYSDIEDEFDIVLVNGKDVAVIETKYKAHDSDLDRLLNKKQKNFKLLYPEYKKYHHHFGLATFHINDDLKNRALENGVIVLQRKGNIIETTVPK